MSSPIDFFFKLGDKVTKGDPYRQQDFTYYMLWIIFLAFSSLFLLNAFNFLNTFSAEYAIWSAVGFAIASLQFFSLKQLYEVRNVRKNPKIESEELKGEGVEEMLKKFK